jgi:hypothetical protein
MKALINEGKVMLEKGRGPFMDEELIRRGLVDHPFVEAEDGILGIEGYSQGVIVDVFPRLIIKFLAQFLIHGVSGLIQPLVHLRGGTVTVGLAVPEVVVIEGIGVIDPAASPAVNAAIFLFSLSAQAIPHPDV